MASRYYFPQDRVNVYPLAPELPMTTRARVPQPTKEYHVLRPGCSEVAGVSVKDKKVKLTAQQARWWLDQGVLGEQAGEHKPGAALGVAEKKKK